MRKTTIEKGYEFAREVYTEYGIDAEHAMQRADAIPVSMNP